MSGLTLAAMVYLSWLISVLALVLIPVFLIPALVPSASDVRWRGLEMFIWLSDVPEDHGPTHIVPLPVTAAVDALPHGYLRSERPDFYEHERSGAGPAGTVVAYSTDTFHRGTEITAPRSARYSAHVSYKHADNTGPAATHGATIHSNQTGTHSLNRQLCDSFGFSAFLRLATRTGPRKPSRI